LRSHVSTNKQALDFCATRRAKIWFDEWRDIYGDKNMGAGVSCRVTMKKKNFHGKTLIQAVNGYIDYRNRIENMDENGGTDVAV
jgi:hypothetical protein